MCTCPTFELTIKSSGLVTSITRNENPLQFIVGGVFGGVSRSSFLVMAVVD